MVIRDDMRAARACRPGYHGPMGTSSRQTTPSLRGVVSNLDAPRRATCWLARRVLCGSPKMEEPGAGGGAVGWESVPGDPAGTGRSEERRVGKEGRGRGRA